MIFVLFADPTPKAHAIRSEKIESAAADKWSESEVKEFFTSLGSKMAFSMQSKKRQTAVSSGRVSFCRQTDQKIDCWFCSPAGYTVSEGKFPNILATCGFLILLGSSRIGSLSPVLAPHP